MYIMSIVVTNINANQLLKNFFRRIVQLLAAGFSSWLVLA